MINEQNADQALDWHRECQDEEQIRLQEEAEAYQQWLHDNEQRIQTMIDEARSQEKGFYISNVRHRG